MVIAPRPAGLLLAIPLALAACSQPAPPAKQGAVKPDRNPVIAIRAAGKGLDSAVQVHPLRDPAVDGFLRQAGDAEAAGRYDAAAQALDHALKLAPDAPDILQFLAEVELERGHAERAERLAMKSYGLGPKVGSLCARNWQTVVEIRAMHNDAAGRADAEKRVQRCRVAPPVRM